MTSFFLGRAAAMRVNWVRFPTYLLTNLKSFNHHLIIIMKVILSKNNPVQVPCTFYTPNKYSLPGINQNGSFSILVEGSTESIEVSREAIEFPFNTANFIPSYFYLMPLKSNRLAIYFVNQDGALTLLWCNNNAYNDEDLKQAGFNVYEGTNHSLPKYHFLSSGIYDSDKDEAARKILLRWFGKENTFGEKTGWKLFRLNEGFFPSVV